MTSHSHTPAPIRNEASRGVILVVDDERAFCDVVCEILEAIGYKARFALNANQALELLPHLMPQVILTDVMMPDMDGLSFVRHLRKQPHWKTIPIVIISAKATPDDRQNAFASGANAFLPKPFSANDLETLMEDIFQT
jgi:CheY-like chemotaxis protein